MGHHPTYFTHFAAAFAETGTEVVPFCPDPEDFESRLNRCELSGVARRRIDAPTRIFGPQESGFHPARWRGHYEGLRFFWSHGRRLRRWEAQHGRKIDLVFFACIYDRHFEHFGLAERLFGFRWAGLYLHARSFRMPGTSLPYQGGYPCPEKIFTLPSMRSVAVLDEGITEAMGRLTGGRPVHVFPDITESRLPRGDESEGLAAKIRAFACGKPVVSLTGHLQWTKGLEDFTRLALRPDMRDVFFFLGGAINWHEIPAKQKAWLQEAWEKAGNIYAHLQSLPEATMNSVIANSDVVFAAYRDFPNSSNVLTKIAIFERPVIVSDGYLMAERVRRHDMGEVVPEGDLGALAAAVRKVLQPGYGEALRSRASWSDYRDLHSVERLKALMPEILAS